MQCMHVIINIKDEYLYYQFVCCNIIALLYFRYNCLVNACLMVVEHVSKHIGKKLLMD